MTFIRKGYIVKKANCAKKQGGGISYRNWWLIKAGAKNTSSSLAIGQLSIPTELIGKRIRFKVEVIEE